MDTNTHECKKRNISVNSRLLVVKEEINEPVYS